MRKKVALGLGMAMALSLFTACGSTSETSTAAQSSSAEVGAASAEAEDGSAEASDEAEAVSADAETEELTGDEEPVELIVFAAASMTETLTEIGENYEALNPHVTLQFNFDSSGTLKTQIEEGADCDVFISAGQRQMNQLDITQDATVNTDGLDFVLEGSRIDLLENKVSLCVSDTSSLDIQSFDDLAETLKDGEILFAMGNSDVPVGQYTQRILEYYELDEAELANAGKITYGSNVKEVTTQVTEGAVDCGVVYTTDAFSAGLSPVDYATAEMCGQVIYPAAVLNVSKNQDEAQKFLDYLGTEESGEIFEAVGFTTLQ